MTHSRLFASLLILFATFSIFGCHRTTSDKNSGGDLRLNHPAYLRIALSGTLPSVDPIWGGVGQTMEVCQQLFVGLTALDPGTLKVKPALATEWTVSGEGSVYTFKLRKDAKWSNGDPLNAQDVVWTLRRNIDPQTATPFASYLSSIKNSQAILDRKLDVSQLGVKALDDYTVEFTLENPSGIFPMIASLMLFRPAPRKVIEKYGDQWTEPENIVTSGPYTLKRWRSENYLILKKNPAYFNAAKVKIEEVRIYFYPLDDIPTLALQLYKQNDLDLIGGNIYTNIPNDEIPNMKTDPDMSTELMERANLITQYLGFNHSLSPVNNPLVRKAIGAALDREFIISEVLNGIGIPAKTFTPPQVFGAVNPQENIGIKFNPEKARQYLEQAGYPGGKNFPTIKLLAVDMEDQIPNAVKLLLKKYLGINVEIILKPAQEYMAMIYEPAAAHMFIAAWAGDYPDAHNFLFDVFHPYKTNNRLHWDNPEFAALVDQAFHITDPAQRRQLYHRAEQILSDEQAAIVPLYYHEAAILAKPWLNWNYLPMPGQQLQDWSFKK